MGGSGSPPSGLCDGLLTEIGRTLRCLSAPECRRQSSPGCKHDFLWIVSFHVCEPHLGGHCHFLNRYTEASFVSVVQPVQQKASSTCERSISKMFPSRSENRQRESLAECRRIFQSRSDASRSR